MPVVHLVAHLSVASGVDICQPVMARRVWIFLRRGFPEVLCANLMPNHPHLIVAVADADWARRRMAKALAAAVRGYGRFTWEHLPDAEVLGSPSKIRRHLRYVTLNPCRAHLVKDPLEWPWTTHRDLVGAAIAPWVRPEPLAQVLCERREGFEARFHRYVSSDRDVRIDGTELPVVGGPMTTPVRSLQEIRLAALAATRGFEGDVSAVGFQRDLFLALARSQAWRDTRAMAAVCGVSVRSIQRGPIDVQPHDLAVATLCLDDRRLLQGPWGHANPTPPSKEIAASLAQFRAASSPSPTTSCSDRLHYERRTNQPVRSLA